LKSLIAPDSIEKTYTAHQVANAFADSVRDGGDADLHPRCRQASEPSPH
jgi:hypothetical protein